MFCEIKFNPRTFGQLPASGVVADATGDSAPFVCLLCPGDSKTTPTSFAHRPKLLTHYAINHRLPFCAVCCTVLASERDRMTHENQAHWPYRCPTCRAHPPQSFFHPEQLERHLRDAHDRRTCALCDLVCSASEYEQHLRLQHDCTSSDFDLAIVAPVEMVSADDPNAPRVAPVTRFHCRLCDKEKLFANFQGHFLNQHKVRLNKFLALTLQFVQAYDDEMPRIGSANGIVQALKQSSSVERSSAITFGDVAVHFEVVKRDDGAESLADSRPDFDASCVQVVGSTDCETSEDDGGAVPSTSVAHSRRQRCPYCESPALFDRVALGRHLESVHRFSVRNLEHRCHQCRRAFASRASFVKHREKVHGLAAAMLLDCPFCELNFSRQRSLRKHIREHVDRHDYPNPPHQLAHFCRYCAEQFWTVDQKNAHQISRHALQIRPVDTMLCGHCAITSTSKTFLRFHVAEAHSSLTQIANLALKCTLCLVVFASMDDLRSHMTVTHPNMLAEYCRLPGCRARIDDGQPLDEHMLTQHGDRFAFTCKLCAHRVLSKQGALKHFLVKHETNKVKREFA